MGYVRADEVTVGMVLDLRWPTSESANETLLSWHVYAVNTRGPVPSRIPLRVVNPYTDETRHVSLNPDEMVWVTGWGVQPPTSKPMCAGCETPNPAVVERDGVPVCAYHYRSTEASPTAHV